MGDRHQLEIGLPGCLQRRASACADTETGNSLGSAKADHQPEAQSGRLQSALSDLARRYDLIAIYSFGSRAGEVAAQVAGETVEVTHPGSDVDIGVLPAPDRRLTAAERADLTVALEDLLEVGRVDLVVLPEAPPFLALDIVRGKLLCTTDPVAEAEYQLYVLRRAADLAPFERQRRQMILAGEAY